MKHVTGIFSADLSQFSAQFMQLRTCMLGATSSPVANAALDALSLRQEYQREYPRHFECVRALELQNPSWIAIEFLKPTPPSHLGMSKLKSLFNLASRVYTATNEVLGISSTPAQSQELATWLYEILKQIELLEAKQSAFASTAKGLLSAGVVAATAAVVNPLLALIGIPVGYVMKKITTGDLAQPERKWIKPLEYINVNYVVRYTFAQESSGWYGHHIKGQLQSYTLGELELDLGPESFSCFFNLNKKHKISPADVSRLQNAMLKNLRSQSASPELYLIIIDALEKTLIARGDRYPVAQAFLDPELALGLEHIKKCCQALISTAEHPIPSPIKGEIVDVSGYKNGCGLYALTVAALRAHRNTKTLHNASIPEYLLECQENWFYSFNTKLPQLHTLLRDNMANALSENRQYQEDCKITFTSTCLSMLEGGLCPAEMSSFFESNQPFWNELTEISTNVPYKLTPEEQAQYSKDIQVAITPKDIALMQKAIQEYFRNREPDAITGFKDTFDKFFTDTKDPISRIIQQRKLFLITCMSCPTLEARQWWRDEAEKWLENSLSELLPTTPFNQQLSLIKLFGFLSCTNFEGVGKTFTLPTSTDCIDTATLRFLIGSHVRLQWPQLFANYVEYVKTNDCMLTAFELQALAKEWNIGLSILEWNQTNETLGPSQHGQLRICLTNPSKIHWQAYVV